MKKDSVYWTIVITGTAAILGGLLTLIEHYAPALTPFVIAWLFAASGARMQKAGL